MSTCDCCDKDVEERSMVPIEIKKETYFVCQSCYGYYSEEELSEKIENKL